MKHCLLLPTLFRRTLFLGTLFLWTLSVAISPGPPAQADPQGEGTDDPFTGEERVTAVDVVVDFGYERLLQGKASRGAPKKLRPDDFEVLYDGQDRAVVAVEAGAEPWTIVIYFDPVLTTSYGVAWAADVLTQQSAELSRLGSIEVVVADPVPRTVLGPTHEADQVHGVLSQMATRLSRFTEPGAARETPARTELLAMRAEFLAEALHPTPAVDPEEFARWVVTEEVRIGRLWLDRLLDSLVERTGSRERRAVILVSSGFDLSPGHFYLPAVDLSREALAGSTPRLDDATETLGRVLAGYGWTVVPLVPPPPEPVVRPGKRIGKWRLQPGSSLFAPFGAAREAERDEEAAEAYLELGMALRGQGKLEDAEEALEKALHHFYGDPRTAERQALAMLELGAVQAALGEDELAEQTFAAARRLDPQQATERLGPAVEMHDPDEPLRLLAESTTGLVVRDVRQLANVVANLEGRVRVTYQVAGLATGGLHPVQVRFAREGTGPRAPGWARSATPRDVASARVRRMLAGDLPRGDLEVRVVFERSSGQMTVAFADDSPLAGDGDVLLRVTCAAGAPDVLGRVWYSRPEALEAGALSRWSYRRDLRLGPGDTLVTVLVEDLYSGSWGAGVVSVEDPDRGEPRP